MNTDEPSAAKPQRKGLSPQFCLRRAAPATQAGLLWYGQLRQTLYGDPPADPQQRKRQSAKVTLQIRMLRAHGILMKAPGSHRYHLTVRGRQITTTVVAARTVDATTLTIAA